MKDQLKEKASALQRERAFDRSEAAKIAHRLKEAKEFGYRVKSDRQEYRHHPKVVPDPERGAATLKFKQLGHITIQSCLTTAEKRRIPAKRERATTYHLRYCLSNFEGEEKRGKSKHDLSFEAVIDRVTDLLAPIVCFDKHPNGR